MNLKMTAAAKECRDPTLPESINLRRVARPLSQAWEAEPRHGSNSHKIISECRGRPQRLRQPTGH
jgi:hypothetical protein